MSMLSLWKTLRVLIVGLVATFLVLGLGVILAGLARQESLAQPGPAVDALAGSRDACVVCHRDETPGIVSQYGHSTMAAAGVTCLDCHEVPEAYAGAVAHEGTFVLNSPTPARCQPCHTSQVTEFNASRHALPAYVAYAGTDDLSADHLAMVRAIPEGTNALARERSVLYELQGPAITRFACEGCHNIGLPQPDGSVGECQSCHLRHTFSLEQVRKPETCNACHIGPDHPQWEIYQESPHGIAYATGGYAWNWTAKPGALTVLDMPAATCATCHLSGFGTSQSTHDVGDRLTWYLFAPVSTRRPEWEANQARMQGVCAACHNATFTATFFEHADAATLAVNAWVEESDVILAEIGAAGGLTGAPFDQPVDFVHFELWHHWGRTAKFGVWMQGPDYVQWHGAYEILSDLAELNEIAETLRMQQTAEQATEQAGAAP